MKVYEKKFTCKICGVEFIRKARYAYYCKTCRKKHDSIKVMEKRKQKNPEIQMGVGSGGNQWGENNHMFKDGLSKYRKVCLTHYEYDHSCFICNSTRFVVVHHIDGDRTNNILENLVMICRSCHAKVHKLEKNVNKTCRSKTCSKQRKL